MLEKFLKKFEKEGEIYLRVKVRPGVSRTEIKEIMDDLTIKINIGAQAEKGKANIELIKILAKEFKVNKKNVKIISGANIRIKLIKINKI